jgi:CheY-like chemotaxis protein
MIVDYAPGVNRHRRRVPLPGETRRRPIGYNGRRMKRIIIYEQLRPLLLQERNLLGRADLIISAVPDTDRALALHREGPAGLIALDLGMPGISIESFCQAIRSDPATRVVSLVLVGSGDARDRMRLRQCQVNRIFEHPIHAAEFNRAVADLLDVAIRKTFRVLASIEVEGSTRRVGGFFGRTENLSSTGLLFSSSKEIEVGETVDLSFFLPGTGRLALQAQVVRIQSGKGRENLFGARFVQSGPQTASRIEAFIRNRVSPTDL